MESVKENKQSSSRMSADSDSQLTEIDFVTPKIHSGINDNVAC